MTYESWKKELTRLKSAATRAKTAMCACVSLAEKIEAKRVVTAANEEIRQHKINRFEEK